MMKIYQKKITSQEDETVLVQFERRHTLKEDANEVDLENHRKTIRANSLGNFGESHSSTGIEVVTAEEQSSCIRKPTVITENELSSSWLYKDRKAKINSDDESVEDSRSTLPAENDEDLLPRTLQDPKLRPTPVSNQRSRKISSCCLYLTIVLVILFACLAVMAGVGGIIYMEYFATYKDKDIANTSVKNDNPSTSKENFLHSIDKQDNLHPSEPKIPVNILKDIIKNSSIPALDTEVSRKITLAPSQSREDSLHNKDLIDSNNKTEELNNLKSNFVSENQDREIINHPKIAAYSNVFRNIHDKINPFIIPNSDELVGIKLNAKNQGSLELKFNDKSIDVIDKITDGHVNEAKDPIIGNENLNEKSSSEEEILDSNEEILASGRNFNFNKITALQDNELKGERMNVDKSFQNLSKQNNTEHSIHLQPNGDSLHYIKSLINDKNEVNSFDHRKNVIDHESKDISLDHTTNHESEDISLDHTTDHESEDISLEHAIDHEFEDNSLDHTTDHESEDNSLDHTTDHESEDNSLDHTTDHESEDNSLDHTIDHSTKNNSFVHIGHSIDPNDKSLNDNNEDSSDFDSDDASSEENSLLDDQNQISDDSDQLVFIRPVVESKAVPVPLAFLRRIGFDIKNPNSLQAMTAKDMDIKFSLAEALQYLRSLDTDNKLPVSRGKPITRKTSNLEESKKTKLPIKSEREEYLNILRKQMFEKTL